MATHTRGSVVLIEAEALKTNPFGNEVLFDPDTSITVAITDSGDTERLAATTMTKNTTGEYFYNVQTAASWALGICTVTVLITDSGDTDPQTSTFTLE